MLCSETDAEFIEFYRQNTYEGAGEEPFQHIYCRGLDTGPSGLILYSHIENSNHRPGDEQRPAEHCKQGYGCAYPVQVEDIRAHVAHHGEKIAGRVKNRVIKPSYHGVPDGRRDLLSNRIEHSAHGTSYAAENVA